MSATYELVTIDERGVEPLLRPRLEVTDKNKLTEYRILQEDMERIPRFVLASLALKFFGDEDLDFLIRDVNDNILDERELKVNDRVNIPIFWQELLASSIKSVPTGRTRLSRTVR